jgi:hypothetical protein
VEVRVDRVDRVLVDLRVVRVDSCLLSPLVVVLRVLVGPVLVCHHDQ